MVEPKHRLDVGRLVPLDLVDATAGGFRLRCTLADFEKLDPAEETEFLPGTPGSRAMTRNMCSPCPTTPWGRAWASPYRDVRQGPLGRGGGAPRRDVHATNGRIGQVHGLVIDRTDRVTHVLLQEGHLWGRKEVAIPISAVTGVNDGIRLNLTKQEVEELPPVDIHHPNG